MRLYLNHDGEWVKESEATNIDDYPHLRGGRDSGPFDELNWMEELRERGLRVVRSIRDRREGG